MTDLWCQVVKADLHSGRGSLLGGATSRRARWWALTLECGHVVERTARYRSLPEAERQRGGTQHRLSEDVRPAPRRASCPQCLVTPYMYVRIETMTRAGLTPDQLMTAAALATTELGIAEGLVMIHGPERGAQRYFEAGGCVRFDSEGNAWVPVTPGGVKITRSA